MNVRQELGRVTRFSATFCLFAGVLSATAAEPASRSADLVAHALYGVHRFRETHDLNDLHESINALYGAVDPGSRNNTEPLYVQRRAVLQGYVSLLDEIDSEIDPSYNPQDHRPELCLVPPPDDGGVQLPSCADPKDIRNASIRRRYEAQLVANQRATVRYNLQVHLHLLRDEAFGDLKIFLRLFKEHGATPDSTALNSVVENSQLRQVRKLEIERIL